MKDKLYLIGEFASMNKVSTRMLRHYDKINLLKPVTMKENGYRYYSEQQISVISRVKLLRDCNFSLDEIAQILKNDNETFFLEQATCKLVELNQQAKLHQRAIDLLTDLSEKGHQKDFVNQYGISMIQRAESSLLISNQSVDLEYVESEFDKLFTCLDKNHLATNGSAILLSRFAEDAETKNQVGVPVIKAFQNEQYSTMILPKSNCISTIHYGDYYQIGYAYQSMITYAELHGYPTEHCFIERYFIDRSHTVNRNQYVTEISVSIKNDK